MRILPVLFLFVLSFISHAQDACPASDYQYQQCAFDVPALSSGETRIVTLETGDVEGAVGVSCESGTLNFQNAICRAQNEGCLVGEMEWVSNTGNVCNHDLIPGVLQNGATRNVISNTNDGIIKYQCDAGELSVTSSICNDIKNADLQTSLVSQQNSGNVNVTGPGSIEVNSITRESCDIGVVDLTVSDFNVYSISDFICAEASYSNLIEILYADPGGYLPQEALEPYNIRLRCAGNFNPSTKCEEEESESTTRGSQVVVPQNCDDGLVTAQLSVSSALSSPSSSQVQSEMCNANGYTGLLNVVEVEEAYELNGNALFNVTALCTGNTDPATRCDPSAGSTVTSEQCGTGQVIGTVQNLSDSLNPVQPTEAFVQSNLCTPNGFDELLSIDGLDFNPSGAQGTWTVTATCSNGDLSSCNNPCLGNPWTPNSTRPPIATNDGVFEDMCMVINPPAEICDDCENESVTFTDTVNNNTCTVSNLNLLTGESSTVPFNQGGFSGEVDVRCNSGAISATGGECFQNCRGGTQALWADARGANSCRATIPDGEYTHGQSVSLNTEINNGFASFECNNGAWEQTGPSQCLVDCTGSASWGSGFSNNGVNKNGLCRVNVGTFKHGRTNVLFNSSTSNTTGSARLSCSDGTITSSSESCNVNCRSELGVWGAGRCASQLSQIAHNSNQTVSTPNALTGYSGSAQFRCSDGSNILGSNSCEPDCSAGNVIAGVCTVPMPAAKSGAIEGYRVSNTLFEGAGTFRCGSGTWRENSGTCVRGVLETIPIGGWRNTSGRYACSAWSPDPSTVNQGTRYTQRRTCRQNQSRTFSEYRTFRPFSRRDFIRNFSVARTVSVSESRIATGTFVQNPCVYNNINFFYISETNDSAQNREFVDIRVVINGVTRERISWQTGDAGSKPTLRSVVVGGTVYSPGALKNRLTDSNGAGGSAFTSEVQSWYEVCR